MQRVRYIVKSGDLFYNAARDNLNDDISEVTLLHNFNDAYYIANNLNIKDERKYTAHKINITYEIK